MRGLQLKYAAYAIPRGLPPKLFAGLCIAQGSDAVIEHPVCVSGFHEPGTTDLLREPEHLGKLMSHQLENFCVSENSIWRKKSTLYQWQTISKQQILEMPKK